jgi:tRNA(Ile)-lysidine synthase
MSCRLAAGESIIGRRGEVIQVLERIRKTIQQYDLLSPGETVVVGVSGGPDSLCLLHALRRLRGEYDLTLHVAHLHHGLRGADADADADYVRALAGDWGLACTVERADVSSLAREHRLAVEEAARRARYSFLSRVARTIGAGTIAVGHNADDQAETVFMHWLRGSGLAGLRGMLPRTSLSDYRLLATSGAEHPVPGLSLIRPLLEVSRAEIEAYCDFYSLEPRFDRSNLDTTYFRNWLRHVVFPLLQGHNPSVQEVIRRSAQVIADDYALLRTLLEETWPQIVLEESLPSLAAPAEGGEGGPRIVFDLAAWRALPTSLQRSSLREAIHLLRRSLRNINFVHVEDALLVARDGTSGSQATLPRGLMLTVGYHRLLIAEAGASEPLPDRPLLVPTNAPVGVRLPGVTPLPGSEWALEAQIVARRDLPRDWTANTDPWRAFLDAQSVGGNLSLRTRRPGDRFQPLGMGGRAVKLADFLTNRKVSPPLRDRLPLLVSEGKILWVCGQRLDQRARLRESTASALVLRFVHR